MSWGVKTTCFKAPGVSLGGSGVSIGGVRILRAGQSQKRHRSTFFTWFTRGFLATASYEFVFAKVILKWRCLPSLKLTASLHLKMHAWNTTSSFLLEWPMFRGEMLVSGSVSWFFVGQLLLCPYGNNVTKVLNMLNIALLDFLWQTNCFSIINVLNRSVAKGTLVPQFLLGV